MPKVFAIIFDAGLKTTSVFPLPPPYNAKLQRDLWLVMWRLAPYAARSGGLTWQQVVSFMETIKSRNLLAREDEAYLEAARARAG